MIKQWLRLFRCNQYLKNLFIFLPLFFSVNLTNFDFVLKCMIAFVLFSLTASSIYIFNDLNDIEEDKTHPLKKMRPLASGVIPINQAVAMMVFLAIFAMVGSFFFCYELFLILLGYFILNILYSLKLKHVSLIDIFIIAVGFVLRVLAGSVVIDVYTSMWIVVVTFLLALFLALAKRRDDFCLYLEGKMVRKNIEGYSVAFIDSAMMIMAAVVIVSYILYTVSPEVIEKHHSSHLYITATFVILGILRYVQLTIIENSCGSPTNILLNDRFLQLTVIGYIITFVVLIYF